MYCVEETDVNDITAHIIERLDIFEAMEIFKHYNHTNVNLLNDQIESRSSLLFSIL